MGHARRGNIGRMRELDRRSFCTSLLAAGLASMGWDKPRAADAEARAPLRLPVWIDGRGPLSFIVDTGASRSALASHAVTTLGRPWTPGEPVRMVTPTGTLDLPTLAVEQWRIGTLTGELQRIPVLPRLALTAADGLLGADAFAGRLLRIDFAASSAELTAAPPSPVRGTSVLLRREAAGVLVVDAQVGTRRIATLLDTGALLSLANPGLLDSLAARGVAGGAAPPSRSSASAEAAPLRAADGSLLRDSADRLVEVSIGPMHWPAGPVRRAAFTAPPGVAAPYDGAALLLGLDR